MMYEFAFNKQIQVYLPSVLRLLCKFENLLASNTTNPNFDRNFANRGPTMSFYCMVPTHQ